VAKELGNLGRSIDAGGAEVQYDQNAKAILANKEIPVKDV